MTKKINVVYYALLRQERGLAQESLESEASTVRELYQQLRQKHNFKLAESQVKAAINSSIVSWETPLKSGDTIVLIPPVAGG